jgi:hypothetical protein
VALTTHISLQISTLEIGLDTDQVSHHFPHQVLPINHNFLPHEFDSAWVCAKYSRLWQLGEEAVREEGR